MLEHVYAACEAALQEGDLVCIFPEGKLTNTGDINTFHHGVSEILRRVEVPAVPMARRGLWGELVLASRRCALAAVDSQGRDEPADVGGRRADPGLGGHARTAAAGGERAARHAQMRAGQRAEKAR